MGPNSGMLLSGRRILSILIIGGALPRVLLPFWRTLTTERIIFTTFFWLEALCQACFCATGGPCSSHLILTGSLDEWGSFRHQCFCERSDGIFEATAATDD
mmetsp:Transcript_33693/g.82846  ORF Transcript_33693/g.82846 Transcript_33693/m.82846 type:complete len:101 (+) Transcript_33693:732-1034(+)